MLANDVMHGNAAKLEPLAALRQLPHIGVLLGCYALLLNLAFAVLPIPAWLAPTQAVTVDAEEGWSFDPLASLCRYGAAGAPGNGDAPPANALACSKCCCPAASLALSGGPADEVLWSPDPTTHIVSDWSGHGVTKAWALRIRAPPLRV